MPPTYKYPADTFKGDFCLPLFYRNWASIWGWLLFTIFTSKLWLLLEGSFCLRKYGIFRISHSEHRHEKGVLKNFAKFTGKLVFYKDAVWRYTTILKKGHRNFQEYLFCETPANGCFCIWFCICFCISFCIFACIWFLFSWFEYVKYKNKKCFWFFCKFKMKSILIFNCSLFTRLS